MVGLSRQEENQFKDALVTEAEHLCMHKMLNPEVLRYVEPHWVQLPSPENRKSRLRFTNTERLETLRDMMIFCREVWIAAPELNPTTWELGSVLMVWRPFSHTLGSSIKTEHLLNATASLCFLTAVMFFLFWWLLSQSSDEHEQEFTALRWSAQSPDLSVTFGMRLQWEIHITDVQRLHDPVEISREYLRHLVVSALWRIKALLKAKEDSFFYLKGQL